MRSFSVLLIAAGLAGGAPIPAGAHGGGLDANGCHYEGIRYHCHREPRANRYVNAPVKKSRENVCHGKASPNYRTLKYFVAYETMEACLKSGGRASNAG